MAEPAALRKREGHLSSHHVLVTGANTGHRVFGPTAVRRIADSFVEGEAFTAQRLGYDFGDRTSRLRHAPRDRAAGVIAVQGGPGSAVDPFVPNRNRRCAYRGSKDDHPPAARFAGGRPERIGHRAFSVIREAHDRAACVRHAGEMRGRNPIAWPCTGG